MLQAMNTGHEGSLSTVHANTPRDALVRLETMVMMGGYELPLRAVRQQISSALDMIVQIERLDDGRRHVTSITEVQRMGRRDHAAGALHLQDRPDHGRAGGGRQPRLDRAAADLPEQVRETRRPASGRDVPRASVGIPSLTGNESSHPARARPLSCWSRLSARRAAAARRRSASARRRPAAPAYPDRSYILSLPNASGLSASRACG